MYIVAGIGAAALIVLWLYSRKTPQPLPTQEQPKETEDEVGPDGLTWEQRSNKWAVEYCQSTGQLPPDFSEMRD